MITVTQNAARQIKESAAQSKMENSALRVAASRSEDDSFRYVMGFDDVGANDDFRFHSEGIEITVPQSCLSLLNGTVIDYVELEPGRFEFIFMNPNDPGFVPPGTE